MNEQASLGWTNPFTDAFGDHPRLGSQINLNDGVTFTLATPQGLDLPTPPRTLVASGNIRTQGETATRAIYRHNRRAVARILVGPMGSYGDLANNLRVPITLQYQPIGASSPVYLDVVGAAHDIPGDEGQWLRLQFEPVEIVFFCRPGLRGDRVTLQNLLPNPVMDFLTSASPRLWHCTLSQYVDCPTTGLPTGNAALTLGCRFKFAANPAANQYVMT